MKVLPILSNSFKGLFTDKSRENNGNWRMEYQPYCWEGDNTSHMVPKEKINIFADSLPDNEEIFTYIDGRESSKDIFGTESYYYNHNTNDMRTPIAQMPSLNREESIDVLNRKIDVFLEMKNKLKEQQEIIIKDSLTDIKKGTEKNKEYSDMLIDGYWSSGLSRSEIGSQMVSVNKKMMSDSSKARLTFDEYIRLNNSIAALEEYKNGLIFERDIIRIFKESGEFVDISRRDINDPNENLRKACQNLKEFESKVIALPHKITVGSTILSKLNLNGNEKITVEKIVEFVETLIRKKL